MEIIYTPIYGIFKKGESGFTVINHNRMLLANPVLKNIKYNFYIGPLFRLNKDLIKNSKNDPKSCYYYDFSTIMICIEHKNILSFVCTINELDITSKSYIFNKISIMEVEIALRNIEDFLNCENKNHNIIEMNYN